MLSRAGESHKHAARSLDTINKCA